MGYIYQGDQEGIDPRYLEDEDKLVDDLASILNECKEDIKCLNPGLTDKVLSRRIRRVSEDIVKKYTKKSG